MPNRRQILIVASLGLCAVGISSVHAAVAALTASAAPSASPVVFQNKVTRSFHDGIGDSNDLGAKLDTPKPPDLSGPQRASIAPSPGGRGYHIADDAMLRDRTRLPDSTTALLPSTDHADAQPVTHDRRFSS